MNFPSGKWVGFQKCAVHGRLRLVLWLEFASGKITGAGTDFRISGTYDEERCECLMHFRFDAPNDVDEFKGYREGKGIWGTWTCPVFGCRGGFHIRPSEEGEALEESVPEEATSEVPPSPSRSRQPRADSRR